MTSHLEIARETLARWTQDPALEPAVSGTFECHIFCLPLDPDEADKDRFVEACGEAGLKALCLGLDYQGKGVVDVLQSTKYYATDDVRTSIERMIEDASVLGRTFEVARLKLEAIAVNPGVPQSAEEAEAVPGDTYFEYHLKVDAPVSEANDAVLKELAAALTAELGIKIPFSCNNMGTKNQRFLNVRTYGMGYPASSAVVERVGEAIAARGFRVSKVIREFIVFDTNKDIDRGWLEF